MAIKKSISVFAPATVGNLACGFDTMGLAIQHPGDVVHLTANNTGKLTIKKITGDGSRLSYDPLKNTVSVAINALLKEQKIRQGFDIVLNKKMPLGSGLGSSAASAVAGVFAAKSLLEINCSKKELIPFAVEGERMACGSAHADNVAPCMLGGIILVRSNHPMDIVELHSPKQLYIVVLHPHVEVLTRDARAVLKKNISLQTGIQQWANTASLVAGLYKEDYQLIGRSTVDFVAEPYRAALIPGFHEVKNAALNNGALACSISGSGSSMFALSKGIKQCDAIAKAMKKQFTALRIKSDIYISAINTTGVRIIK